jgi:hypothetical protein
MSSEQYFGDIQDESKSTINNVGWLYSQKYRLSHEKGGLKKKRHISETHHFYQNKILKIKKTNIIYP